MNCATCGAVVDPTQDAFCPGCGSPVQAPPAPAPQPYQQPAPGSYAPTAPMPVVAPAPAAQPAPQPAPAAYPQQPPQGAQPVYSPQPGAAVPPRRGLSGLAIAGIIVGVLVGIVVLGVAGLFAFRAVTSGGDTPVEVPVSPPVTQTEPAEGTGVEPGTEMPGGGDAETGGATEGDSGDAATGDAAGGESESEDGIVTDAQARETVAAFMDARMAKDVTKSRSYCTKTFLNGEWKDALKDPTWRPDSYEIVNSSPDLMYVHVVVSERWPSGDEYWIYSVVIDPAAGKPLIDGTLDPQYVPELLPK